MISIDSSNGGAMETSSVMIVRGVTTDNVDSLDSYYFSSFQSGPEFAFDRSERPTHISFFLKLGTPAGNTASGWGALIEIRSLTWSDMINDHGAQSTSAIAVFVGEKIKHTANCLYTPSQSQYVESMTTLYNETKLGLWYKIDIFINWDEMVYDISIDDHRLTKKNPFSSKGIKAIAISNIHPNVDAWIDEIYVGDDTGLGFECSHLLHNNQTQNAWSRGEYERLSSVQDMSHHKSHLLQREIFSTPNHGTIQFFDGQGHSDFRNDAKFKYADEAWKKGPINPRSLLEVFHPPSQQTKYMYYGEYINTRPIADYGNSQESGGVFACSSTNWVNWKNEGLMLSFRNITNMVEEINRTFIAKRPNVLYNRKTKKYVMWMIIENEKNDLDLGMTGVAISNSADGPFQFVRSFYPDGNKTKDQTLYMNKNGTAFLIRTYYTTVDYILPEAVMQPIWESVKDGVGLNNFALNFHRANYEPDYDNYHDIDGNLTTFNVKSRFLDPSRFENNIWRPQSVVGVKAQPWKANYRDGSCGIRKRSDNFDLLDPDRIEDRAHCSNIADNPTHPTPPDIRIGLETVAETRLAKYIAISKLTDDFLDTAGNLATYEGGLDDSSGMVPVFELLGIEEFGWDPSTSIKSTYASSIKSDAFHQEEKWTSLFHQYEETYNDRAFYSLACLLDNKCPVNFKAQVIQ